LDYDPVPESDLNLALMRRIDELHLQLPFYGARRLTAQLNREGHVVNRKRVRRLMGLMGITAIYEKPRISAPNPEHKIYPYLLKYRAINAPNDVWCADITYVPMAHGFMYLVAVMDWFSRYVLAWELSNTMEADFCVNALDQAMEKAGRGPEIFNTDQGAQFTAGAFVEAVERGGAQMSMDGRGRWIDNRFIERLWRSYKYEDVYLHAYETPQRLGGGTDKWMTFYNEERVHQALDYRTPREVFFA